MLQRLLRTVAASFGLAVFVASGLAQAAPQVAPADTIFRLDGGETTYVFGVNEQRELQTIYWGGRLGANDPFPSPRAAREAASFDSPVNTTPEEYAGWGGGLFVEPALKISFPNGNRDLELRFLSASHEADGITVTVKDVSEDVYVHLHYTVDSTTGIIGRSSTIENKTKAPVTIQQAAAATWNLPRGDDYTLRYLTGRWAAEWQVQQRQLQPGATILESRRGSTGHQNNPWFALEHGAGQDEDTGEVWFGALAWSGSWRITVEQDQLRQVRITGGYNPFDFSYKLAPGDKLDTPVFYGGHTSHGIGEASRLLHQFELAKVLPQSPKPRPRPVIYNSWEATEFAVDEPGQTALAEKAARIGVERFVMDDGWFGARNTDRAGLGDWNVNPAKFPHGLKPLIDKVHALGMDFGLWVEPEMVNPDSDLYRKHPDWVLNFPGRPRTEGRNQLVLNLARPTYAPTSTASSTSSSTKTRSPFSSGTTTATGPSPAGLRSRPMNSRKSTWSTSATSMASFGNSAPTTPPSKSKAAPAAAAEWTSAYSPYTDEVWPSDNTDPFDRLRIQDGFTYAYTPGGHDGLGDRFAQLGQHPHHLGRLPLSLAPCKARSE